MERSTRRAYSSGPVRPFFADLLYSTRLPALVFYPIRGNSHLISRSARPRDSCQNAIDIRLIFHRPHLRCTLLPTKLRGSIS